MLEILKKYSVIVYNNQNIRFIAMNGMATRTVQTLKYGTDFIQSFSIPELDDVFELRSLKNKIINKHYILIFNNTFLSKKDWEDEKIISEISVRNSKIYFNIKISTQYPEFANYENILEQKISAIIKNQRQYI